MLSDKGVSVPVVRVELLTMASNIQILSEKEKKHPSPAHEPSLHSLVSITPTFSAGGLLLHFAPIEMHP